MTAPFQTWEKELEEMPHKAAAICEGLSDEQINWRPDADHWSIAQCLDHLNRANGKILGQLEQGIRTAASGGKRSAGEWKPGWMERLFIRMVSANAPFKSPVPPDFVPADRASAADILPKFEELHRRYLECLRGVEREGLVRVKVASPVSRFIKCSLGTWFAASIEHDLYHIGQAEQVRNGLRAQVAISE